MGTAITTTVAFTDLVGSTELLTRLGKETANEIRRVYFSLMRDAVAAHNGTEVKNLGDGLMVVYPNVAAAVDSAIGMQQRIHAHNQRGGEYLAVRIGICTGDAIAEDDDFFGAPVVQAARLCDAAQGGQILATAAVGLLAAGANRSFTALGDQMLKGIPEPVASVEVGWAPIAVEADVPLPGRVVGDESGVFVGRALERAAITDAFKETVAGGGRRVVLIAGEAGMGKTTLATYAAREAFAAGAIVLYGRCDEELAVPYRPMVEALEQLVRHAPEAHLAAHVANYGSELTYLVPALARRVANTPAPRSTDPDTQRYLLFGAVVNLLATISQEAPVVLLLDDLHWADKPTTTLLRHLVASTEPARLLILGTYRDMEISRTDPFSDTLAAWRREPGVERIQLSGLADLDVLELMEKAAGHELEDTGVTLAHAVHRETDGNPFFVGEILRHLAESGLIYQDATGHWEAADRLDRADLPQSVREVVAARVARLGPQAERVLSIAAVIGQEFDVELLARTSESSEDDVLDILEAAKSVTLVQEAVGAPGRYVFSHALIQSTLYSDLGPTHQARAHRRVGEALEIISRDHPGSRLGELAHHWYEATQQVDATKALDYCAAAAEASLTALAPDAAARYYEQALQLYEGVTEQDPTVQLDLSIGLGIAQRQAGNPTFRETLLEACSLARDLGDSRRLVAAAIANNRGYFSTMSGIDHDKVAALEAAVELMADSPSVERAMVLATLCNEIGFISTFERRQQLAREARSIAESLDEPATTLNVINQLELPLDIPHTLAERDAATARAFELAGQVEDPVLSFWAANWRSIVAGQAGRVDEEDRCLELMTTISRRVGQPMLLWNSRYHLARRAMLAGDPDEAERLATEALEIGTGGGQPDAFAFYGAQLIAVHLQRGTLGDLVPLVQDAVTNNPDVSGFKAALALAHTFADQRDEALALLQAVAPGAPALPLDMAWLTSMTLYAEAAVRVGARNAAEGLIEQLREFDAQISDNGLTVQGPVAYHLGGLSTVVGRYDEADTYFAASTETCERVGATFHLACTKVGHGRMLLTRALAGDVDRGRRLVDEAATAARAHGYAEIVRLAEQLTA